MKKTLLFYFILISISSVFAQNRDNKNAMTYKMLVTDYNSMDKKYIEEVEPNRFLHPDDVNFGAEIGYTRYLNASFNANAAIRLGSMDAYHLLIDSTDGNCINTPCDKRYFRNELFSALNLTGTYKFNNGYILKENFVIAPYIQTGISLMYMNKRSGHFDFQIPFTFGLNIRLNDKFALQTQLDYNQSLIINKNNLVISAGFVWTLGKNKNIPEIEPMMTSDRDDDGIIDKEDKCPDIKGSPALQGCPETDKN
jgi:OOP family OmpA-OmpF porin